MERQVQFAVSLSRWAACECAAEGDARTILYRVPLQWALLRNCRASRGLVSREREMHGESIADQARRRPQIRWRSRDQESGSIPERTCESRSHEPQPM